MLGALHSPRNSPGNKVLSLNIAIIVPIAIHREEDIIGPDLEKGTQRSRAIL